jgi:hypothetical protein
VIERNRVGILPRNGERECLKAVPAEGSRAVRQKPGPETPAAILPAHANLGYVPHIFAYPRAEQQRRDLVAAAVRQDA